jgi:hypothetical protein
MLKAGIFVLLSSLSMIWTSHALAMACENDGMDDSLLAQNGRPVEPKTFHSDQMQYLDEIAHSDEYELQSRIALSAWLVQISRTTLQIASLGSCGNDNSLAIHMRLSNGTSEILTIHRAGK